jgi:putative Mn2+ efflux pump MntP
MAVVLLVALALGLSNLAASIGIGASGVSARLRLRVAIVFGVFEAGMPLAGLALGYGLDEPIGHAARWIGTGLLIAVGLYGIWQTLRGGDDGPSDLDMGTGRLLVTGLALSVDNLAAGFALGTYHASLVTAVVVIAAVSVVLSLIGLELGSRIGTRFGRRSELLGGIVLIIVGCLIGAGVL